MKNWSWKEDSIDKQSRSEETKGAKSAKSLIVLEHFESSIDSIRTETSQQRQYKERQYNIRQDRIRDETIEINNRIDEKTIV